MAISGHSEGRWFMSALPPKADILGRHEKGLLMTQSGHSVSRAAPSPPRQSPNEGAALPKEVEHWSMTTLREKLVKIGDQATLKALSDSRQAR